MRKISGVLLALAASLALGATTVAAKDDVGFGGGGGGEKMQNEGKGGGAEKMQNEGKGGKCYHRHACAHRWGWGGPRFRRCLWHHGC